MLIQAPQLQMPPQLHADKKVFKLCRTQRNSHSGFSLIELMVVIAIIGIMATFAAPAFRAWIANTKTRSVAEALQNGLRLAQTEAVRRGVQAQFVLTNDAPTNTGVTASVTGRNWIIQTLNPVNGAVAGFAQGAALGNVSNVSLVTADAATITFNSLGRMVAPAATVTYAIQNNAAGGDRSLNVIVNMGGSVRMCDPSVSRASRPDGCQ